MDTQQALKILGLGPNPSPAELKHAYREQVRLWHPDRYSNGSSLQTMAEKHIQDANLAYAFLKRAVSSGTAKEPPRRTAPPKSDSAARRSAGEAERCTSWRLWAARLGRHLPKIDVNALLTWLRRDVRNHFRPWYRYPDGAESAAPWKPGAAPSFGQILDNTLQRSSGLKRLHTTRPTEPSTKQTDTVTPITGVSASGRVKRP